MSESDQYLEPDSGHSAELKVKGSRFVAQLVPVFSVQEAAEALATVRKEHYDATHHCSAWRVGVERPETRFNDDGEPSGTAGMPILRQIEGAGLTNTLIVVTRYYGGTKLGTGGLARAYGGAAAHVLDETRPVRRTRRANVTVRFDYADTSPAMHTIGRYDVEILDSRYGVRTVLDLAVRLSEVAAFEAEFFDALGGRADVALE